MAKIIKSRALRNNTLIPMEEKEDYEPLPNVPSKQKWKSEDVNTHIANIKANNESIITLNANMDYIRELLTKVEDLSKWKTIINEINLTENIGSWKYHTYINSGIFNDNDMKDKIFKINLKKEVNDSDYNYGSEFYFANEEIKISNQNYYINHIGESGITLGYMGQGKEEEFGLFSIYYFRTLTPTYQKDIINNLQSKLKDPLHSVELMGQVYWSLLQAGLHLDLVKQEELDEIWRRLSNLEELAKDVFIFRNEKFRISLTQSVKNNIYLNLHLGKISEGKRFTVKTSAKFVSQCSSLENFFYNIAINWLPNEIGFLHNTLPSDITPLNLYKEVRVENVKFEKTRWPKEKFLWKKLQELSSNVLEILESSSLKPIPFHTRLTFSNGTTWELNSISYEKTSFMLGINSQAGKIYDMPLRDFVNSVDDDQNYTNEINGGANNYNYYDDTFNVGRFMLKLMEINKPNYDLLIKSFKVGEPNLRMVIASNILDDAIFMEIVSGDGGHRNITIHNKSKSHTEYNMETKSIIALVSILLNNFVPSVDYIDYIFKMDSW